MKKIEINKENAKKVNQKYCLAFIENHLGTKMFVQEEVKNSTGISAQAVSRIYKGEKPFFDKSIIMILKAEPDPVKCYNAIVEIFNAYYPNNKYNENNNNNK